MPLWVLAAGIWLLVAGGQQVQADPAEQPCTAPLSPDQREFLQHGLEQQQWRTAAWNIGFSYGILAHGAFSLASSQKIKKPFTDEERDDRAYLEVSGVRSTLSGFMALFRWLPYEPLPPAPEGESECAASNRLLHNLAQNVRYQRQRPYKAFFFGTLGAVAISSYILSQNYGSWAAARRDGIGTFLFGMVRIWLMPTGLVTLEQPFLQTAAWNINPLFVGDRMGLGISFDAVL